MSAHLSDWGITRVNIGSKSGNTSHDSIITTSNDDTSGRTFNAIGGEKCQVLCFKDCCCRVCVVTCLNNRLSLVRWKANQMSYLWFRFTSKWRVVNFHIWWLDDSKISWDTITAFDFNYITKDESSCQNSFLFTSTNSKGLLWDHVFEGFHNCIGFRFLQISSLVVIWGQDKVTYLVILENTGDDNDSREDNTEIKVIFGWIFIWDTFDWIGKETEDSTNP